MARAPHSPRDYRAEIATLTASIRAMETERAEIERQTRSRAEVEARVRASVARHIADAERRCAIGLVSNAYLSTAGAFTDPFALDAVEPDPKRAVDFALLLVGAERATAVALAAIGDVPVGLDAAARAKKLASMDDAIFQLEIEREACHRAADLAGQPIPRDPLADCNAVLAMEL